ncbi:MAG: ornithine cyclodeaminase family protein [Candidatus Poribacteria bacterium]|nr:ornithine cyclodeaminase family protein [Candidatus Poribacteria bacterium]
MQDGIISETGSGKDEVSMEVLIINQTEVDRLLPMDECMNVMAEALKTLGRGDAINPLRQGMWLPEKVGVLGMMPAYLDDINAMGLKVLSIFPSNHGTAYDSHQGAVMLFETTHGRLLAMIDATAVSAIRTAAVSGVATKLLARAEAADLAILGSGVQAQVHLEAMRVARQVKQVRVWSRTRAHAETFAQRGSERHGIPVTAMTTAQEAVAGADLICTTTAATAPVLIGEWLAPGVHINAVGAYGPSVRELDTSAVVKSRLFVDRRESTFNESGDFLIPKQEGVIGDDHIQGEIGEILLGQVPGRRSSEEITLFKSLGLGVEDVASAHYIYQKAIETNLGTRVEFGGHRHIVS